MLPLVMLWGRKPAVWCLVPAYLQIQQYVQVNVCEEEMCARNLWRYSIKCLSNDS